ncbi:putative metallopeptidase [Spirosoma lituiforme]
MYTGFFFITIIPMRPASLLLLLLLAGLTGCQSGSQPEPVQYSVPTEVEPFVKSFRDEAKKRNNSVSTDNLIITFGTAVSEDICGECQVASGKTPRIVLNGDAFCWQQASQYERECLVFHELGHCLLARTHRTDKFANGAFVSLMNPADVTLYATCRYPIGQDECDKRPRRDYYIDELFDSSTPAPAWGK